MKKIFVFRNLCQLSISLFFLGILGGNAIATPLLIAQGQSNTFPVITPTTPAAKEKMSQGLQRLQQGQLSQGIQLLNEAIALDPNLWQAHYNLGLALRQKGDLQGSANAFHKAISIEPKFALGYASIGGILVDVKNWSQAKMYLDQALSIEPNLGIAHYNLGLIHRKFDRPQQAIQSWETATQLSPGLFEASLQLAEAYIEGDRLRDAEQLLETAPSTAAKHYLQGRIAAQRGRSEMALTSFRKASQLDANYANAYYSSAQILINNNRTQAAIPLLDYAVFLYSQQGQTQWLQKARNLRQQVK